jgi:hypothetical protein
MAKTPLRDTFEELPPARTAEEFIEQLRPSAGHWKGDDPLYNGWIFRGQADAVYPLVPSAFRPPRDETLFQEYQERLRAHYKRQGYTPTRWAEWAWPGAKVRRGWDSEAAFAGLVHSMMVRDFFLLAHRAGHPTTPPAFLWHLEAEEGRSNSLARIVDGALDASEMEEFAIAQHHGIPTQLLDWTYNPLVAAHFAADPLMRSVGPTSTGSIAVWALWTTIFRRDWEELRRVTVTPTAVPFLDAQQGLFTWSPLAYRQYAGTGSFPCVEDLVAAIGADPRCPDDRSRPFLRKLTLPKREVPALLRLLWREGITVAQLMPTLDHVTQSLRARSYLQGAPS